MKRCVIIGMLTLLMVAPQVGQARSTTELEATIQRLLAQVEVLRERLAEIRLTQRPTSAASATSIELPQTHGKLGNTSDRQVAKCDPFEVSEEITSSGAGTAKSVTFGFSECAGGLINSVKLSGFDATLDDVNLMNPDVGGSWASNFIDKLHDGNYNPAISGYQTTGNGYGYGTPVTLRKLTDGSMFIPRYAMTLWGDTRFDFLKNEVLSGPDEVIDRFPNDGGNSDEDGYADRIESNIIDELRSGFEYTGRVEDVSGTFGLPAFGMREVYEYAQDSVSMNQFNKRNSIKGEYRITDLQLDVPGGQRPGNRDLSHVIQTKATRLITDHGFKYLFYRSGEQWVRKDLPKVADKDTITCAFPLPIGGSYSYVNNVSVKAPRGSCGNETMSMPLVILSTDPDPERGVAVGVYISSKDPDNRDQIIIRNVDDDTADYENRRMYSIVGISKKCFPGRPCQYSVGVHDHIAALLNPGSASELHGYSSTEAYKRETVYLFGTPTEILTGINVSGK